MANSTQLKSDALLEQMKLHLSTDAGKDITKKVGLVYQINIAPKVAYLNWLSTLLTPVDVCPLTKQKKEKDGLLAKPK